MTSFFTRWVLLWSIPGSTEWNGSIPIKQSSLGRIYWCWRVKPNCCGASGNAVFCGVQALNLCIAAYLVGRFSWRTRPGWEIPGNAP